MIDGKIIAEQLKNLGVKPSLDGYKYLKESVKRVHNDAKQINNVVKGLYADIADEFNTTNTRVERAMRHAVEVAWDSGAIEEHIRVFGNSVSMHRGRPTVKEFIATVAEYLHDTCDKAEAM